MRHDIVEVVRSHESVVVQIRLREHLLQLLLRHVLPKILSHALQLQNCDLAHLMGIEGSENLVDISTAVFVAELGGSQLQKLVEAYTSRLVLIEFSEDLVYELVLSAEAEVNEGLLEFLGVYGAAAVAVEDVEGELDVLDLLERDGEGDVVFGGEALLLGQFGWQFGGGSERSGLDGRGWAFFAHSNLAVIRLQPFQKTLAHPIQEQQYGHWDVAGFFLVFYPLLQALFALDDPGLTYCPRKTLHQVQKFEKGLSLKNKGKGAFTQ